MSTVFVGFLVALIRGILVPQSSYSWACRFWYYLNSKVISKISTLMSRHTVGLPWLLWLHENPLSGHECDDCGTENLWIFTVTSWFIKRRKIKVICKMCGYAVHLARHVLDHNSAQNGRILLRFRWNESPHWGDHSHVVLGDFLTWFNGLIFDREPHILRRFVVPWLCSTDNILLFYIKLKMLAGKIVMFWFPSSSIYSADESTLDL